LTAFPKTVHLVIYLFGVEGGQLFSQLLQSYSRLDMRNQVEHMNLCRAKRYCFHNYRYLLFCVQKYDNNLRNANIFQKISVCVSKLEIAFSFYIPAAYHAAGMSKRFGYNY